MVLQSRQAESFNDRPQLLLKIVIPRLNLAGKSLLVTQQKK